MLVTPELINYLTRVVNALDTNTLHPDARRTDRCPECDERVEFIHDSSHLVWVRQAENAEDHRREIVLIVACEGYWVIDPNIVGIDKPEWIHPDDHLPNYDNPDN